jgi:hypothetical protein
VVACARLLAAKTGAQPELPITARPPLHPIPLGALASLGGDDDA